MTQYSGCGKSHVVSISPETGSANDNAGGYFSHFKFSGWDALEVQENLAGCIILLMEIMER